MSARSHAVPAARSTSTNGNGGAVSIRASSPGGTQDGTAVDFASVRADFEAAWREILPTLADADFDKWRDQRDFTAWKYTMWDARMKLPTQLPSGRSRCYCGASIDIKGAGAHIRSAHSPVPGVQ
jgi:hypothetical protein